MVPKKGFTIFATFAICGISIANAQNVTDKLQPLVETSARRLAIARQVALAKWDSGAAVEDVPREEKVITGAMKDGQSKGLDPIAVSKFFKAQIEANKTVQYALLADWHRAGRAPAHSSIELAAVIRPQLDQIQGELVAELADTVAIRTAATCQVDLAKAVGQYLLIHKSDGETVFGIALDRALAGACMCN